MTLLLDVAQQGQFFSAGEGVRIYLLGNPIIWWSNLAFMGFYLFLYVIKSVREKRGSPFSPRQLSNTLRASNRDHYFKMSVL